MRTLCKFFKPSKARSIGDLSSFKRVGEWTTNGIWIMKTGYEPDLLRQFVSKDMNPELVDKFLKEISDLPLELAAIGDELKFGLETIWVKIKSQTQEDLINVYYLSLFEKIKYLRLGYFLSGRRVVVKMRDSNSPDGFGDIVGVIMPKRREQ